MNLYQSCLEILYRYLPQPNRPIALLDFEPTKINTSLSPKVDHTMDPTLVELIGIRTKEIAHCITIKKVRNTLLTVACVTNRRSRISKIQPKRNMENALQFP